MCVENVLYWLWYALRFCVRIRSACTEMFHQRDHHLKRRFRHTDTICTRLSILTHSDIYVKSNFKKCYNSYSSALACRFCIFWNCIFVCLRVIDIFVYHAGNHSHVSCSLYCFFFLVIIIIHAKFQQQQKTTNK